MRILKEIIVIAIIFIVASCVSTKNEENVVDKQINALSTQLQAGMTRNEVASILETNNFQINSTSPPKKDPQYRTVYLKTCCKRIFTWIRYDAFIQHDKKNRLKSARFLKSRHSDGSDTSCYILFELPADSNRQYPYQCPNNVQDF